MVAGGAIYRDVCSGCHAIDGKGVPDLFPALASSSSVRSDDPASLIRVILRGARSVATSTEPTAPGMPAFGWQLDDEQLAAVVTLYQEQLGLLGARGLGRHGSKDAGFARVAQRLIYAAREEFARTRN